MKPCYGYGEHNTGLCRLHRHYYDDTSFIDKIIEVDSLSNMIGNWSVSPVIGKWIIRMLKASKKSSQELCAKLISLYKAPHLETVRYIYEMGLDLDLIEPFDAPAIWKDGMKLNLYVLTGMPLWCLYGAFERRVFPYLKCSDRPQVFKNLIGLIKYAHAINEASWKEYFEILLPHIMNLDLALIDKETLITADTPLKQHVRDFLEILKQKELGERASKMEEVKWGVAAGALHPDSICPYIKEYGIGITSQF